MTAADVAELEKYAPERITNEQNYMFANMLNIVGVGSYHDEGAKRAFESLMATFKPVGHDEAYLHQKLDKKGLDALKQRVQQIHGE